MPHEEQPLRSNSGVATVKIANTCVFQGNSLFEHTRLGFWYFERVSGFHSDTFIPTRGLWFTETPNTLTHALASVATTPKLRCDRLLASLLLIDGHDHVFDRFHFGFCGDDCVDFFSRFYAVVTQADQCFESLIQDTPF